MRQLEISITLDRAEYLSGEDPRATIRVKNPTKQVLEIYAPFHNRGRSKIILQSKSKYNLDTWGSEWWAIGHDDAFMVGSGLQSEPTTTIQPGAVLSAELYLDGEEGVDAPVYHKNFVMLPEGDYRVGCSFGGGWAPFHVVQPRQASVRTFDRTPLQLLRSRGLPTPRFVLAALQAADGQEALVIPTGSPFMGSPTPQMDSDGKVSVTWLRTFAPFVRVVTGRSGLASYEAHEDGGQVVVSWEEKDGGRGQARLDRTSVMRGGVAIPVLRVAAPTR